MRKRQVFMGVSVLLLFGLFLTACTAGDPRYTVQQPAGFWHGLWHGVISVVAFVISLFNGDVTVYEVHNTGAWYNLGFLLGVTSIWGGGSGATWKSAERRRRDEEWAEIGERLEEKILTEIKKWTEEEEHDEEWEEVEEKIVRKIKRKLKEWAEEE